MFSPLLGTGTWHTALEKFLVGSQLTAAILPGMVHVEVFSRSIIQFLEMFMDLGGQREADLKYSHGFV
jgi:hypothetical protein